MTDILRPFVVCGAGAADAAPAPPGLRDLAVPAFGVTAKSFVDLWIALRKKLSDLRGKDARFATPRTTNGDVVTLILFWSGDGAARKLLAPDKGITASVKPPQSGITAFKRWRDYVNEVWLEASVKAKVSPKEEFSDNRRFWRETQRLSLALDAKSRRPSSDALLAEALSESLEDVGEKVRDVLIPDDLIDTVTYIGAGIAGVAGVALLVALFKD